VAVRFVLAFGVVCSLIIVAASLDSPARRMVFAAAILLDVLTPLLTLRHQALLPRLSTSKFPERFGLFTIIVLGEAIVGVIIGISELNEAGRLGPAQMTGGGLALAVGIGLWWNYFDFIARRSPKARIGAALGWVYLHLGTLAAITATGAAISVAISGGVGGRLEAPVRLLLGGSVAAALVGFALLELTLYRHPDEPTHPRLSPAIKVAVGAVIGAAALLGSGWSAVALLGLIAGSLAVPAAYGVVIWYSPTNPHRAADRTALLES
jgi:low temperature requirement protein LtrA